MVNLIAKLQVPAQLGRSRQMAVQAERLQDLSFTKSLSSLPPGQFLHSAFYHAHKRGQNPESGAAICSHSGLHFRTGVGTETLFKDPLVVSGQAGFTRLTQYEGRLPVPNVSISFDANSPNTAHASL